MFSLIILFVYSNKITLEDLAKIIDHTNLKPYATKEDITRLCNEAIEHHFGAVCVNSSYVSLCYKLLDDTDIKIAAVVGFPLGASITEAKVCETKEAIKLGAQEIDMVMNVAQFRNKQYELVERDIKQVVEAADGGTVKVILETGYLTDEQIIHACEIAKKAGAHYVKTSTGFGPMGAYYDHVKLMREVVGESMGVKAAGGIRDAATAIRLVNAGANRIGASSSVKIIEGLKDEIEKGKWFEDVNIPPEKVYSWGAADKSKQPKDVYNFYLKKKKEYYKKLNE